MTHATERLAGSFSASDERISLEMGRIYKVGYIGMVLSAIVAIFYGVAVEGVVADHQLLADAVDQHAVHCLVVLAFGMCVTACIMLAMQLSKGIAEDSKFAEADAYPLAHYVGLSAAVAIALGLVAFVLRGLPSYFAAKTR